MKRFLTLADRLNDACSAPNCAPATIGDLKALFLAYESHRREYEAATSTDDKPVSRRALCQHFGVSNQRMATAIQRAGLVGIECGSVIKYPKAAAIQALVPYLAGSLAG